MSQLHVYRFVIPADTHTSQCRACIRIYYIFSCLGIPYYVDVHIILLNLYVAFPRVRPRLSTFFWGGGRGFEIGSKGPRLYGRPYDLTLNVTHLYVHVHTHTRAYILYSHSMMMRMITDGDGLGIITNMR